MRRGDRLDSSRTPRHTTEELNEAATSAKKGGDAEREALLIMMRPYVVAILRRVGGTYTRDQRDEMTQAAYVGVVHAMHNFDPDNGAKFSYYAKRFIHGEVQLWLARNTGALPMPRVAWAYARGLEKVYKAIHGPGADINDASPEELGNLELDVNRQGGEQTSLRIPSAPDIFAARKPPSAEIDPESRATPSSSAEDQFFDDGQQAEEVDFLDSCYVFLDSLDQLKKVEWLSAIESYCEERGFAPEAAPALLQMKEETT